MRILITWWKMQERRTSSLAADYSWESAAVLPSRSSMVGAILATAPIKARTMRRWAGNMPKNFSNCCAARALLSLTHVQCSRIRQACCALSHTLQYCVIEAGGDHLPSGPRYGHRSEE